MMNTARTSLQGIRQSLFLEQRQYKNNSIQSKKIPVLILPRFFPRRVGDEKERQFQNWTFFTEWSRSYIFLALLRNGSLAGLMLSNNILGCCVFIFQ